MTDLIIRPLDEQEETTATAIRLTAYVAPDDYVGLYDRLEFWRSTSLVAGPYEELTAESLEQARIPDGAADAPASPVDGASAFLVDKTLEMLVNGTDEVIITFTGVDPLTYAEAATQITDDGLNKVYSYVTTGGVLVVRTYGAGAPVSLEVTGGDAAPLLGLPISDPSYGKEPRMVLQSDGSTLSYTFTDWYGSDGYFYKTRFRNASNGSFSEFSTAIDVQGSRVGISPDNIVTGRMRLVLANGKPLINTEVRLHTEFNGTIVEDHVMAGSDMIEYTDAEGLVEFSLVIGQKVSVAIPGTNMHRTITVPSDAIFNLWDPAIADDDIFNVVVPNVIAAERRSL